jgi:hypothetical protein
LSPQSCSTASCWQRMPQVHDDGHFQFLPEYANGSTRMYSHETREYPWWDYQRIQIKRPSQMRWQHLHCSAAQHVWSVAKRPPL